MLNKIYNEILNFNKIIIIRHRLPDFDAYGSQLGLYFSLKNKFKDKTILVDGDEAQINFFGKKMDSLTIDDYKDSLVISVDVSSLQMLVDEKVKYAKRVIIMDHHENDPDYGDLVLIKSDYSSASELITEFLYTNNIEIPKEAADSLYTGIVGDSNRFYYKGTSQNTFKMCSILVESGADILKCYKNMQKEESELEKKFKGLILSNFKIDGRVAYCYTDKETRNKYGIKGENASRMTVNLLSSIIGVEAFVNFVEDDEGVIYTEFRSKNVPVVSVASFYGGGGHSLACGARLKPNEDILEVVKKLNKVVDDFYEQV